MNAAVGQILSIALFVGIVFGAYKLVRAVENRTMEMPIFIKILFWYETYIAMGKTAKIALVPVNHFLATIS